MLGKKEWIAEEGLWACSCCDAEVDEDEIRCWSCGCLFNSYEDILNQTQSTKSCLKDLLSKYFYLTDRESKLTASYNNEVKQISANKVNGLHAVDTTYDKNLMDYERFITEDYSKQHIHCILVFSILSILSSGIPLSILNPYGAGAFLIVLGWIAFHGVIGYLISKQFQNHRVAKYKGLRDSLIALRQKDRDKIYKSKDEALKSLDIRIKKDTQELKEKKAAIVNSLLDMQNAVNSIIDVFGCIPLDETIQQCKAFAKTNPDESAFISNVITWNQRNSLNAKVVEDSRSDLNLELFYTNTIRDINKLADSSKNQDKIETK